MQNHFSTDHIHMNLTTKYSCFKTIYAIYSFTENHFST